MPTASKLVELPILNSVNFSALYVALRDSGYSPYQAISDIVDNSVDAGADKIRLDVFSYNNQPVIVIADNGSGMSRSELLNALSVGSTNSNRAADARGKYGMGLTSASASLGDSLTVISKSGGVLSGFGYSQEDISDSRWPIANRLDEINIKLFDLYLPSVESGTVVLITQVHKFPSTHLLNFRTELSAYLGQSFRKFMPAIRFELVSRKNLYCTARNLLETLKFQDIPLLDPMLEDYGSTVLLDETREFEVGGRTFNCHLKAVLLPEEDPKVAGCEIRIVNQGFYILRNNRQIDKGSDFYGALIHHNEYNRFRAEISFDSAGDSAFGINYQKNSYTPHPDLIEIIKTIFTPYLSEIRSKSSLQIIKKKAKKLERLDTAISKLGVSLLQKLLNQLKASKSTSPLKSSESEPNEASTAPKALADETSSAKAPRYYSRLSSAPPRFEYVEGNANGILSSYRLSDELVIYINVNHPLYIALHSDQIDGLEAFRLMLLASAVGELSILKQRGNDPEDIDLLSEIREMAGQDLAALTEAYVQ